MEALYYFVFVKVIIVTSANFKEFTTSDVHFCITYLSPTLFRFINYLQLDGELVFGLPLPKYQIHPGNYDNIKIQNKL